MYGYIYKTTNLINNKIYIGQHKSSQFDVSYLGSGYILKNAVKKYGKKNFKCEVIEWCDSSTKLDEREIYWIKYYNSIDSTIGYNISNGGLTTRFFGENHPMYGKHHTKEAKEKNRIAHLGKKQSQETIEKRIGPLRGKHLSEEHKAKISSANKGKVWHGVLSDDGRKHISESSKNRVVTEETREKIRKAHLGKSFTDEHRKNLSLSHVGQIGYWNNKSRSDETKKKISNTLSGKSRVSRRIRYMIGDKLFIGLDEGAQYYGVTKSCMSLWLKNEFTKNKEKIIIL